jgi:hypothetical protein
MSSLAADYCRNTLWPWKACDDTKRRRITPLSQGKVQSQHFSEIHAKTLKNFYITIVLYTSAVLFLKMTLLVGYYRVLAVQNSRKVYIAAIILVGGWSVSQLGVAIFGCSPIHGFWDFSVKTHCINTTVMWYTNVAGNIATDLIVIILPIPAIVKLNLPNRQKWYLVGIFILGTL